MKSEKTTQSYKQTWKQQQQQQQQHQQQQQTNKQTNWCSFVGRVRHYVLRLGLTQ